MESTLDREVKGNKKDFCKYTGDKRKPKENVAPWLNKVGYLITQDMEEAEILNVRSAFRLPEARGKG